MSNVHTWLVFCRVRIGTFVTCSLLDLALAVIGLVILLSGWSIYDQMQRVLSLVVFSINMISALGLILLSITRIRPMVDLGCAVALLLIQIGSVVTYNLAAPLLPCSTRGLVNSCKGYTTFILYGTVISCAILCLYLLVLFPMLKIPQPQSNQSAPYHHSKEKSWTTISDTASSLTYHSWDRNPAKGSMPDAASFSTYQSWDRKPIQAKKHQSTMSQYSQASFANQNPYNFTLDSTKRNLPYDQKPLTVVKKAPSPRAAPSPLSRMASPAVQRTDLPPNSLDDNAYLRPYTPPPVDQGASPRPMRGSVASINSQDTSYAASWLMEPPRAVLSSPKQSSGAMAEPVRVKRGPSSGAKPPRGVLAKMVSVKKHRPGTLTLDTFQDPDSVTLSDVPRSPSPVDSPYSSYYLFPPTPRSGVLPKHPRLTMHMREASLAGQTPFSSPRM